MGARWGSESSQASLVPVTGDAGIQPTSQLASRGPEQGLTLGAQLLEMETPAYTTWTPTPRQPWWHLVALYAAPSPPRTHVTYRGLSPLHFTDSYLQNPHQVLLQSQCMGRLQSGARGDFMFGAEWRDFIEHFRVRSIHILRRAAYFNKLDLIMSQFMLRGAMHKSVWKWRQWSRDLHSIKLGTEMQS